MSLTLDNVQCCGKTPFETVLTPMPEDPISSTEHVQVVLTGCKKWLSADPDRIWPGRMKGLLHRLTGRCTGLESLTLSKVDDRYDEECDLLRNMKECCLLVEWSSFIRSVWEILDEFLFESGPRQESQLNRSSRVHPVRIMDRLFGQF